MRNRRALLSFFCLLFVTGLPLWGENEDPSTLVNVFIGTGKSVVNDNGLTSPSATLPFGMISWGPDPISEPFYHYDLTETRGFSLTHLNGVGCPAFGDIPIMPVNGALTASPALRPAQYTDSYSHRDEVASPGYYSVTMASGIKVQLAVATRSGIGIITYPPGQTSHSIIVDLSRSLNRSGVIDADIRIRGNTITGSSAGGSFCSRNNRYRVYFAIETRESPEASYTFKGPDIKRDGPDEAGWNIGGALQFAAAQSTVHVRVGISYVSVKNALMNLRAEIPGWDFNMVREAGHDLWTADLNHIEIHGGSRQQEEIFYTALYHSLLTPTIFNDVDGQYIGFDDRTRNVGKHNHYANFSAWDIYRSQVQLVTMLFPQIGSDLASSLLDDAEQGGGLPVWPLANDETGEMVGDPSDIILASIYAFGGTDFAAKRALDWMLRGADDPTVHSNLFPERPDLREYLKKGYVSETPDHSGSASITLEYTTADFAISEFAGSLGDEATATRFLQRSAQWKNLFDEKTGYIRPRSVDGSYLPHFSAGSHDGFVEGNAAQYTWMVPYDFKDLIRRIGGAAITNQRLDQYFSQYGTWNGGPFFLLSNEPSFSDPWIYNWTGQPWRTQEVVRKTIQDLFRDTPGGLPGNDDCGATSSWLVFAQLGIFPAIPGIGGVTLNTPTFPEVVLRSGEHSIVLRTSGEGNSHYIRGVRIDDQPIDALWIPWSTLRNSRAVVYELQATPFRTPFRPPPSFGP